MGSPEDQVGHPHAGCSFVRLVESVSEELDLPLFEHLPRLRKTAGYAEARTLWEQGRRPVQIVFQLHRAFRELDLI